jgi:2'-5' RNA ligase
MAICVASVLGGQLEETVHLLWSDLRCRWGLELSHPTGVPHLTLAILNREPRPGMLQAGLATTAAGRTSFPVSGAGYGVFVGHGSECPVVYLAMTRTPQLSALHEAVVRVVTDCGGVVDGQTLPQFWSPHVTLADRGLAPAELGQVMHYLAEHGPRHWTVDIDNLSIVTSEGLTTTLRFGEPKSAL